MATLTISLSGSNVVNGSKSWTVTNADVQKLVDCLIARHSALASQITAQQALLAWAQQFVDQTRTDVHEHQRSLVAVAPIGFS